MQYLGRYELLGEIASGGMATVYLGRVVGEGGFEREVAIKVMHEHLARDPEFVAMFLDEARLAARIRHPNVVPTLDVERTDQVMFLVMDFVEGLSLMSLLRQVKKRGGLLPVEHLVRVMLDTLQGLHAAHELTDRDGKPLELVHRDVSPANVLVGTDGVSRLTDFGVARAEARLTSTRGGRIKGKLQYMPPEQISADSVDRRADVYAAGVVLWECLTGRRLFDAQHEGALLQQVLAGAVQMPSQLVPTVPQALDLVCANALAVAAERRYPTAAAMADHLEESARAAGVRISTPQQLGVYVRGFNTNASAISEARKAAPGLRPDLLLASTGLPQGTGSAVHPGSGLFGAAPGGVASLSPPTGPGIPTPGGSNPALTGPFLPTSGAIPSTSTAAMFPTGATGVRELDHPHARRTLFIGLGAGVAISAIVVVAFVSGKASTGSADSSAHPPPPVTASEVAVAVQSSTASSATSSTPPVESAPTAPASASADAGAVASARPGTPGTAKPKGTGQSAADFLPGTL